MQEAPVGEWWYQRSSDGLVPAFQSGASSDRIVPADYTGDGKTDIAVFRPATGEWYVLRSENLSFFSFPFGSNGDIPMPADFDNDGTADPAVFRPSNAMWLIQRSSDNGTTIAIDLHRPRGPLKKDLGDTCLCGNFQTFAIVEQL